MKNKSLFDQFVNDIKTFFATKKKDMYSVVVVGKNGKIKNTINTDLSKEQAERYKEFYKKDKTFLGKGEKIKVSKQ